jgi:hypothetical protein
MMQTSIRTLAVALGAIVLSGAFAAQASTVTISQTLDLTQAKATPGPGFQGWSDTPAFNGGVNFDLAEGDALDFTIDFLGAQTLTLTNASFLWAFIYSGSPVSDVTGTGTLSLLDGSGTAFLTSNSKTSTEGSVHFGQQFNPADFTGGLPASLTFSGLRFVGTLDDYVEVGVTTRNYNNPAFFLNTDEAIIGGAVPEPGTWALMIGGFGMAGAMLRRRTNSRTAIA